jgi:glycosyltransferase involved in cell wall biosynthesis
MIGQKGIPSRANGIDIHVEELSKRLVYLGYEVEAYCTKSHCDRVFIHKKFAGIVIKYSSIAHTFTATLKALLSSCDIFHYHGLGPSSLAFIPRVFGKKVVCTVHGLDWQRGKMPRLKVDFLKFGEYATAKFAHKTINVSKNLVEYYRDKYKLETEYIPNGIDRPDILKSNIIRQEYGLETNRYILFLSRLAPEKGAHYLIEAFNQISTDKKLVIAGGNNKPNHYERQLRNMAENNKNIIFTGFVRDQELAELYSNTYFYVLPSNVEGMPISLLEAMSYSNCCLVSDIPDNMAVISTMGYSFEKANVADLVDKLNMLLNNESKVLNVKKYSGEYIIRKYNWDQVALKTSNIYKSLFYKKKLKKLEAKSKNNKVITNY